MLLLLFRTKCVKCFSTAVECHDVVSHTPLCMQQLVHCGNINYSRFENIYNCKINEKLHLYSFWSSAHAVIHELDECLSHVQYMLT